MNRGEYQSPKPGQSRSPCPALNALSNHGYLERDGRDIGVWDIMKALKEAYNISYFLGFFLTVVGMLLCAKRWSLPLRLDLEDLSKHNAIEHDVSMTRADAQPGCDIAPACADRKLLKHFMEDGGPGKGYTIEDFARLRIRRAIEAKKTINGFHKEIAHGEAALTLAVFGRDGIISLAGSEKKTYGVPWEYVKPWFGDDRLPFAEGWRKPNRTIGLMDAAGQSKQVANAIQQAKDFITGAA